MQLKQGRGKGGWAAWIGQSEMISTVVGEDRMVLTNNGFAHLFLFLSSYFAVTLFCRYGRSSATFRATE